MKSNRIWLVTSVFVCCLLMGCSGISQSDLDASYQDGRSVGYDDGYASGYSAGREEGYDEGFDNGYENARDEVREEFIDELYSVDGYVPVYMDTEIMDALMYLVEERNGNAYRPEEYAIIVSDFFEANYYYMTAEQVEAFENILAYCADAEWITTNIASDIQRPPS